MTRDFVAQLRRQVAHALYHKTGCMLVAEHREKDLYDPRVIGFDHDTMPDMSGCVTYVA